MMKNTRNQFWTKGLLILTAAFLMQACQREKTMSITEEDAADVIAASLESETGGMVEEIAMKTKYVTEESNKLTCGNPVTVFRTFVKTTGIRTGNFTYNWVVLKNCSEGDTSISWTGSFNGSFETPRLSGSTSGSRNWTIQGIEAGSNSLTMNGNFVRSGSHQSKVRQRRSFSSEVFYEFSDIIVNKGTRKITSGTGSVQVSINASNGATRNLNGTIIFNGNGTATLLINGKTFEIILYN